jgi:hypothetical protein
VVVAKKDGTLRLCVDYTLVNRVTVADSYPLEDIHDMLQSMAGSTRFSQIDLRSGFWQIPLDLASQELTAFWTPLGLLMWTVLPFGLKNASAQFQRIMQHVLRDTRARVYVDNIVLATSEGEHGEALQQVIEALKTAGFILNREASTLNAKRMSLFGYVVSASGWQADPERVTSLLDSDFPSTPAMCRGLLGRAGYFRLHVKGFSQMAAPLFDWAAGKPVDADKVRLHFEQLKSELAKNTLLAFPRRDRMYTLETDASDLGTGAVLSQPGDDGQLRPIAFHSHKFNEVEARWTVTEQELVAIVLAVRAWQHHLLDNTFRLRTDHRNLLYLASSKIDKLVRWRMDLGQFKYNIEHVPGRDNVLPDFLSRQHIAAIQHMAPIHDSFAQDAATTEDVKDWQRLGAKQFKGRWQKNGRPAVPAERVDDLFRSLHGGLAGHMGADALANMASRRHLVAGVRAKAKQFIENCAVCAKLRAPDLQTPQGTIRLEAVLEPFQRVHLDTLKLPVDNGCSYVQVAVDELTGYAELQPLASTTAVDMVQGLVSLVARHRMPEFIHSDGGPEFDNGLLDELAQAWNITKTRSVPRHPQSNGIAERKIREVLRHTRGLLVDYPEQGWRALLPWIAALVNRTPLSRVGISPHELLYGSTMSRVLPEAPAHEQELLRRRAAALARRTEPPIVSTTEPPQEGDWVFIAAPTDDKLKGRRGPYKVIELPSRSTLLLVSVLDPTIVITRSVADVARCPDITEHEALALAATDANEYVVSKIVGHTAHPVDSRRRCDYTFIVEWEGYEHTTSEPWRIVRKLTALDHYLKLHPALASRLRVSKGGSVAAGFTAAGGLTQKRGKQAADGLMQRASNQQ